MNKVRVTWTGREEDLVAKRAEEIRTDPENPANRHPSGQRARSMASCYIIAQQVLPIERHKAANSFHVNRNLTAHHEALIKAIRCAEHRERETQQARDR